MPAPSSLRRHLAVATIAAAATAALTGFIGRGADARPVQDPYGQSGDVVSRLQTENQQLRSDLSYYQAAYTELDGGLDRIESANQRNRDRGSRRMIQRAVDDTRARAAQYVGGTQDYPDDPRGDHDRDHRDDRDHHDRDHRNDQPSQQQTGYAISTADFNTLTTSLRAASFADDQLALVRSAATTNLFTVAQVVTLMQATPFDDSRVQIAATLRPRVIDSARWFTVYDALTFSTSKDALRKLVGE